MRWFKRITVTLLSLLTFLTIAVSLLLLILDDEDYRGITVSLIEKFTNLKVTINGPFTLDISLNPTLTASLVQIHTIDNDITVNIGKLTIAITLRSLFLNHLRITNTQLDDIDITVNHTLLDKASSIELTQESHEIKSILLPILEQAAVNNLILTIKQEKSTLKDYLVLSDLTLGLNRKKNKHILSGNGLLNNYKFKITGDFGNLSNLLIPEIFPINTNIQLANMKINITGNIQDPLTGTGVNLKFNANTDDFLKVFRGNSKIPFLGSFTANADIVGNLPNVAVENINLKINNLNTKSQLLISGKIPELRTGKNALLTITGQLNDSAIFNWLIPENWPSMKSISAKTLITNNDDGNYVLNNIQIDSLIDDNIRFTIVGSAILKNISSQPFNNMNLLITGNTDSGKFLQQYISKKIPDLGSVKLTAKLKSKQDYFQLSDIAIITGDPKRLNVNITGKVNKINLQSKNPLSDIQLKLHAHAKTLQTIENILKSPLPDLSNLVFTADFFDYIEDSSRNNNKENKQIFSLKNILLSTNTDSKDQIKITGAITNIKNTTEFSLNGKFNIRTKKLLKSVLNSKHYPDLGTTKASFVLRHKNNHYSLDNIKIETLKSDEWKFTANGNISHLMSDLNISMNTTSKITNWSTLKEILNKENLDYKPESGSGKLSGDKNKITFYNNIIIGKTQFNFGISAVNNKNRYQVTTFLETPLFHLIDFGIKPKDITTNKNTVKTVDNKNKQIISNKTLPFKKLNSIDLTANLKIDNFSGTDNYLKALDLQLNINKGMLRLHPATLSFSDGNVSLDMGISPNKNHDSYVKLKLKEVDLGSIMSQLQKTPIIKGSLSSVINLTSYGDTLQKIATNSKGDMTVVGENIEVLRKYTNLLASDTLGWATSTIGLNKQYSQWSCSILKFDIIDSKVKSDILIVDGPEMRLKGKLSINLNDETIDMSIWPQQKNTIWVNAQPVTLTGPIRNPTVNAITVGTSNAARTYGELILAPQIFLPLRALGYINTNIVKFKPTSEGPCQKLEKEIAEIEQQNIQNTK